MALANVVKFTPASSGTGDFVYSSTAVGFRTPVGNLTDGSTYSYRAESADLSEWEIGTGAWTSASSTLARTTVVASSTGSKVSFTAAPSVGIVALAADILQPGNNLSDVGSASSARTNLRVREMLLAARTYYVRTDGSDSNDGLTNTAGGAFLTLQKALDVAATIDFGGYTVTIQLADGTYNSTNAVVRSMTGQASVSNLVIQGNASTPANVVLAHTTVWDGAVKAVSNTYVTVKDLKITTTTNAYDLMAIDGGQLEFSNIVFGGTGQAHVYAATNGIVKGIGNYTISGSAIMHFYATTKGTISVSGYTATFSGSPSISDVFAQATAGGLLHSQNMTWSGTVTVTKRYYAAVNGAIETYGAGANYFPGTAAGTTATGGQYD